MTPHYRDPLEYNPPAVDEANTEDDELLAALAELSGNAGEFLLYLGKAVAIVAVCYVILVIILGTFGP